MEGADDELLAGAQARVGRVLKDKWHLDRLLGIGGMAAVYEATHRNRSRVAVKMLHPSLSLDREVRQRFLREGYVANSVEHEGVVRVLDDDVDDDGTAFLVLDLLEGETLDARWASAGGRLPVDEVGPLIERILDVLGAAHAKGIVHRDVKPENIFLTARGEVKLLDFGIARLRETSASEQAALTRSGATMGTPVFMAPEQARGRWEQVDERTDVWAVGAMMFTLLSGHWVHEAETWNETLILAAIRPARSLSEVLPDAPAGLVAVVDRALAFEKADRWASALAMREGLRALGPAELGGGGGDALRDRPLPSGAQFEPARRRGSADPLGATEPGGSAAWPPVGDTRPPVPAARTGQSSTPGRFGPTDTTANVMALAPNPTVVAATMRTSTGDGESLAPKGRSRFPTWLVLLAVAGGGAYAFRAQLLPHLDAWSARGAVSAEGPGPARPDDDGPEPAVAPPPPSPPSPQAAGGGAAVAPPEPSANVPAEPEGDEPEPPHAEPAASSSSHPTSPVGSTPPKPSSPPVVAKPPVPPPPPPKKGTPVVAKPPPRSKTTTKPPGKPHHH